MDYKYFKMLGGIERFQTDAGIVQDLSNLNIRQVIKRKNQAKTNFKIYSELFASHKKRQFYTRYLRATINACNKLQEKRRQQAVDYYYSLPPDERTSKNWIKYTKKFAEITQQSDVIK